jgi:hypothetical protein
MEEAGAKEDQSGSSSDAFAGEDEEFEKLFGFRNTSIYEDDETDIDRGRSYGRTRFDDDDDFEYDDEYSYDEDDDVLTDDELEDLADDEENVPERGKKKGGFFSKNPFVGLAGLFGGKKKSKEEDYEDDEDSEYEDYEDDEDSEYEDYEDDEDSEYEDYEDDEDFEGEEDELPDFGDSVKRPAGPAGDDGEVGEPENEESAREEELYSEYEVDDGDFTELKTDDEDEDDGLTEVEEPHVDEEMFSEGVEDGDEEDFPEDEYEDGEDFPEDEYEDGEDFPEDDEYEDEDDFLGDDGYEDEDNSTDTIKKSTSREPRRGGFFSGLGKSISSLIGSSRRKDDDDDDYIDDFDDEDDEEEMRGDVIDRLERNFENSVGRSGKYVVPAFDDSYDDLDSSEESEEETEELLPYEDYDIPEINYTDAEAEARTATYADDKNEDVFEDDEYKDTEYKDDLEDDAYDEDDENDIYDELEEDDTLSSPGIRKRSKGKESEGKKGSFFGRLKAAFGGMKKQSRKDDEYEDDEYEDDEYEDDEYEDDEYEDDEYEDDEYEDDEYEDDEYEDDEYEDDEYEDDEYEDDEYEDDEYEDDEYDDFEEDDEPAPVKKTFGKIFMRKKPEKKVRGWNSEPVGKWNDEEEGVFDLDRDIDSVDITNLSDRLVAALDDDMIEEIHPDLDE